MEHSLHIRRQILPWGFTATLHDRRPLPPFHLPLLVDVVMRTILPAEALRGLPLTDLRGAQRDGYEELLSIRGFAPPDTPGGAPDAGAELSEPFEFSLLTSFEAFKGNHHIIHRVSPRVVGALPADLDLHRIGSAFPLRITEVKLGLELFRSRLLAILGFTPVVTESLSLRATEEEVEVTVIAEGLAHRDDRPTLLWPHFAALGEVLLKATGGALEWK